MFALMIIFTGVQTREHCYEMMEKALYENFVAAFEHDSERIGGADYEPRCCALDIEHETFLTSKQAMMYKVSIMKVVSEIRKLTQGKTPHVCFSKVRSEIDGGEKTEDGSWQLEEDCGGDEAVSKKALKDVCDIPLPSLSSSFFGLSSSPKSTLLPSPPGDKAESSEAGFAARCDTKESRVTSSTETTTATTTITDTVNSGSSSPALVQPDSDVVNLPTDDICAELVVADTGTGDKITNPHYGQTGGTINNLSFQDLFGDDCDDDDDMSKSALVVDDSGISSEQASINGASESTASNGDGEVSKSSTAVPKIVYFWEREDYKPDSSEETEEGSYSHPVNGELKSSSTGTHRHHSSR